MNLRIEIRGFESLPVRKIWRESLRIKVSRLSFTLMFLPIFACASALLLSSCCFYDWHMGRATIELSQIHKGVDGTKPIGTTIYAPASWNGMEEGQIPPVYAIEVPEVSYVHRSNLVSVGNIFAVAGSGRAKHDITPTGKTRWLLVKLDSTTPAILEECPPEASVNGRKLKLIPHPIRHPIRTKSGALHYTETQHTAWCIPAYVVATPLFAMDCTMDFIFNTGAWVVFFICAAGDAMR